MADFINTVDVSEDDAVVDSIIDRSITEYKDNIIKTIGYGAFYGSKLSIVDCPALTKIDNLAFISCGSLRSVILRNNAVCTLASTTSIDYTPVSYGSGYIYVPRALVDTYKAASNWSKYANQFRALEDYTVDGTTTGELDPTKI